MSHLPTIVVLHAWFVGQHHAVAGKLPSEQGLSLPLAQPQEPKLQVEVPLQMSQPEPQAPFPAVVHVVCENGQHKSLLVPQQVEPQKCVPHELPASAGATHVPYDTEAGFVSHVFGAVQGAHDEPHCAALAGTH